MSKKFVKIFFTIALSSVFHMYGGVGIPLAAQTASQQLSANEKELKNVNAKLSKLKSEEAALRKKIEQATKIGSKNKETVAELRKQLEQKKKEASDIQNQKEILESEIQQANGNFTGLLKRYYKMKTISSDYYGKNELEQAILAKYVLMGTASDLSRKYIEWEQAEKNSKEVSKSLVRIEDERYRKQREINKDKKATNEAKKQANKKADEIKKYNARQSELQKRVSSLKKKIQEEQKKREAQKKASTSSSKTKASSSKSNATVASGVIKKLAKYSMAWPASGKIAQASRGSGTLIVQTGQNASIRNTIGRGQVLDVDNQLDLKNYVAVYYEEYDLAVFYGCLKKITKKEGDWINTNETIGQSDSCGSVNGYALQFLTDLKKDKITTVSPELYLKQ